MAKANNLDLEIVPTDPFKGVSTEYLKLNKLGKVPTFEGKDGFVLTECIAIAIYREYFSSSNPSQSIFKDEIISYSYPCLKILLRFYFISE